MDKLKLFWRESWLLLVSSLAFGIALAAADAAWKPRIRQNEINKFNGLAVGLLASASARFEPLPEPVTVTLRGREYAVEIKRASAGDKPIAWAFVAEGSGFADAIKLVVVVDAAFETIKGFDVLYSNETPGFGDRIAIRNGFFQKQFAGAPAAELQLVKVGDDAQIDDTIVAISGATVSSQAVVDVVNAHIEQIKKALQTKGLIKNGR